MVEMIFQKYLHFRNKPVNSEKCILSAFFLLNVHRAKHAPIVEETFTECVGMCQNVSALSTQCGFECVGYNLEISLK